MTELLSTSVYLLRHPSVHQEAKGICYGDSDVPLEAGWEATLEPLIAELRKLSPRERPKQIWHSDLVRTREPAILIASRLGLEVCSDPRLRERFFGTWQSMAWSAIPPQELEMAHAMLEDPAGFRPGGGETTNEVQQRARSWWNEVVLSRTIFHSMIAVAHSGTITSLCGGLLGLPPLEWTPYYLTPSQYLLIKTDGNAVDVEISSQDNHD